MKNWKLFLFLVLIFVIVVVCLILGQNNPLLKTFNSGESINKSVLNTLEGLWEGIDNSKYSGTDLVIKKVDNNSFSFEMEAFWLNAAGYPHDGRCDGKGYIKDNLINLDIENGAVKGKMTLNKDIIHIEYQGDMGLLGGVNVRFSNDFKKKK